MGEGQGWDSQLPHLACGARGRDWHADPPLRLSPPLSLALKLTQVRVVGMGKLIKWEASYTVDAPRQLSWQSLSGFQNAGVATFESLGDDR